MTVAPARRAARDPARARRERQPVPQLDPRAAPRIVARSALADAASLLPPLDAAWPAPPPPRRSPLRRRLAALVAAGLVVAAAAVAFVGTRVVLARFTDAATVTPNTFATGSWVPATTWYLHNSPTPPADDTTAQLGLALDDTAPTEATLHNYDTDCDSRVGRALVRGTGLVGEAIACRYATWRSAPLASARTLSGTATLAVYARKSVSGGTDPTLRVFLRVLDPATSTHTELGAANVAVIPNANQAWVAHDLAWSLANVVIPAGRRIELKLVATDGTRDLEIAYDTTAYASSLTLP